MLTCSTTSTAVNSLPFPPLPFSLHSSLHTFHTSLHSSSTPLTTPHTTAPHTHTTTTHNTMFPQKISTRIVPTPQSNHSSQSEQNEDPATPRSSQPQAQAPSPIRTRASTRSQLRALFAKSATYQLRQKKSNCCQIATALIIVLSLFALQRLVDSFVQDEEGATLPGISSPPTLPPALFWTDTSIESCRAFQPGPYPAICNFSDPTAPCPSQPNGVLYGDFWVATGSGGPASVDPVAFEPWLGGPGTPGANASLFGGISNAPIRTVKGKIWPDRGNFQEFCDKDPYWTYPFNFTHIGAVEDKQASLYNNFRSGNQFGGFVFHNLDVQAKRVEYSVHINESLTLGDDAPLFMSMALEGLVKLLAPEARTSFSFAGTRDMPTVERENSFDLISLLGPVLYIYVFQLMIPPILSLIVFEKEHKLREIMRSMGLKDAPYWIVNYTFGFGLYICFSFLFWALCAIFRFRYWTLNSPGAIFLLLFIWGHVLMAIVFFLQVFFSRTQSSSIGGYLFIFTVGLLASEIIREYLYQPETPRYVILLISCFPPFAFYRGLVILSQGVSFGEPGLQWKDINDDRVRMGEVFGFLIAEWVVLMLLATYLEMVYTSGYGIKHSKTFFLEKKFWANLFGSGRGGENNASSSQGYAATPIAPSVPGEPEDVAAERTRVREGENTFDLRLADLCKTYPGQNGLPDKEATTSLTLGVSVGECLALLGPSGAGKSTTISMISGLFPPSSGTAHVCGFDVRTDIDLAHLNMGVCPQEDLLWADLTGPEHLLFYARIKNVPSAEVKDSIADVLAAVGLNDKATRAKKTSEYSGGMRRRLSVAIALIGSPRIVLLDELSTGLDPKSRSDLWRVISDCRSRCAMILTTHSMEESEVLADKIAIIVDGQFKAIGTPPDLKFRYGTGYKLTLTATQDTMKEVQAFVGSHIPDAVLLNALSGTANYEIPKESVQVADLFQLFDNAPSSLAISDWGLSNSSLEEVFLKVCDGAQAKHSIQDQHPSVDASSPGVPMARLRDTMSYDDSDDPDVGDQQQPSVGRSLSKPGGPKAADLIQQDNDSYYSYYDDDQA